MTLKRLVVPAAKTLYVSTDVPVALVPATDAEMVLLAYSMSRVAPLAQGNPGSTSPPSHRVRLSVIESPLKGGEGNTEFLAWLRARSA